MENLKSFLRFEQFIMPFALQTLFWAAIGGTLYGAWWLYSHDNWAWIIALVCDSLGTRLIFESLILRYRSYIVLTEIHRKLGAGDSADAVR